MLQAHLLKLLILASSLLAVSCKGTLPIRPSTDICMVSLALPTADEPEPFQGCICSTPDGDEYQLPGNLCDKHVAIAPEEFQALAEYVLELEKLAQKGCKLRGSPAFETVRDFSSRYGLLLQRR